MLHLRSLMLLDKFGQSNKFRKKSYKKFWDIQVWVFWGSSRGRPENVPGMSWINLEGTFLERQIRTSPGLYYRTSPGRQIGTSLGWSNRIFRGGPGDVGGGNLRDDLWTNFCWLGKGLEIKIYIVFNLDFTKTTF